MKNKIVDLRNHLFAQLERLGEEDLSGEELNEEISRAKSIVNVGSVLVDLAKVEVDFVRITSERTTDFFPKAGMVVESPKRLES